MKTIFRVAKAELLNLFYSPVAWLVTIFFFIICGLGFTEPMMNFFRVQKIMLESDPHWHGFDGNGLSVDLTGRVLEQLVSNLYLFIPLLTMGVINREVNSGTMKLLYSSPIRIRDIVLGKYLGLLVLVMILVVIVSVFMVSATLIIKDPDYNRYFAVLLGVFLVANAFIAIGLFISCVTNYQIVAGVLTFVVFFILESISGLWQQYDFFRDITYFLSISGRASYLLNGLISTRDLFFFILITVLFLGFALIRLRSTQESKPWTVSFVRYTGLFTIVILLGYFTSRPGQVAYWDLTARKMNTISTSVQGVLKELDGSPLTVTLYTNLLGRNAISGLPQNRNFYMWQIWEQYRRFYPNMNFKYVYYYDIFEETQSLYKEHPNKSIHQIAEKFAKELGIRRSIFLKPEEIKKQVDLSSEGALLVMQLEYKGKKTWLRTYPDNTVWPGQGHVAGALSRLTRKVPKLLFTAGHYERNPYRFNERDYGVHVTAIRDRGSLVNLGVDADTISLRSADLPANNPGLIIADPRASFEPAEQDKLIAYLKNGGNAFILAEINKQSMLNPILNTIGVHIDKGTIVNPNAHEMPHILKVHLTRAGGYLADEARFYLYQHGSLKELRAMVEGGANISYKDTAGFKIEPVIEFKDLEKAWIENGPLVVDSAAPTFAAAEGDVQPGKYVVGIKMTRTINNKEQRIIVTGDADIMTAYRNADVGNAFYSYILYNQYPFYSNYPRPKDTFFTAGHRTANTLRTVYIYVIPVTMLVLAIVLLVRRKRK
jgi:ABC-2 type transport system permease protein